VTNPAGGWQQGYEPVHFPVQYSFLHPRAGLNEAQTKWQWRSIRYPLAANFASRMGTYDSWTIQAPPLCR